MGNSVSASSSSPGTTGAEKYDVFISFRGEDTRNNFTSHLHTALCRKQINTFIDDGLEKGDGIWLNLSKNIRESKISVVIFSKDYASSKWCLRELVEILECREKNGQIVIPVFYQLDPSRVRGQKGSFEDSFVEHEKQVQEEVPKWRKALTEASNLTGWDSSVTKPEAKLVEEIVRDIEKKLTSGGDIWSPSDFKGFIGLGERIEQVMSLLCLHKTDDIRIIGIWGMGGIGKTTIANVVYNKISHQFDGKCFIRDVRGRLEQSGGSVLSLQEEFVSKVLGNNKNLKFDGTTFSKNVKKRLSNIKVLIVLDDVDDFIKLEELVGGLDQFGFGSRIMMTSRDKQVFENCMRNARNIYEVKGLDNPEALKHFFNFAFKKDHPTNDLRVLSIWIVNYAKGNPLALKVLGSSLYRKSEELWKSAIVNLQENFKGQIFDMLKISYDKLEDAEKNMFLDIACFLKGKHIEDVTKIYGDSSSHLLSVLEDKSLITGPSFGPFKGKIDMHDLLQEMGREIVRRESNRPGNRSRLWRQEDVLDTLKNGDGTDAIRGIVLRMDMMVDDIYLSPQTFEKMKSLKFLKFWIDYFSLGSRYEVHCPNGLLYLSNQLRSLNWSKCPLKVLPSNFIPNYNLIELDLSYSNLETLKEDIMFVPKLKWLILKGCQYLTSISKRLHAPLLEKVDLQNCVELLDFPSPDESSLKQLREFNMTWCKKLKQLPSKIHCESLRSLNLGGCTNLTTIPDLSKASLLVNLNLKDCVSLATFPRLAQHPQVFDQLYLSGCTSITSIPSEIYFRFLHSLDLQGCNNLTKFPNFFGNITSLNMSGTAINEIPLSIQNLTKLLMLDLSECIRLEHISTGICKLKFLEKLILKDCSKLKSFPDILETMEGLKFLDLSGTAIEELPNSIGKMTGLLRLNLRKCKNLETLPNSICNLMSLAHLDLSDCSNLKILSGRLAQSLPERFENSNVESLFLDNCNVLQSLTDLPSTIKFLSASDCKQLRSIPQTYKFAELDEAEFIFTNCQNLRLTMISDILKQVIDENKRKYLCETRISICCPGDQVPCLFNNRSNTPYIEVQANWWDLKGELVGFAVCAVIEFREYHFRGHWKAPLKVLYECRCNNNSPNNFAFQDGIYKDSMAVVSRNGMFINSDHVALRNDMSLIWPSGRKYTNFSFKFWLSEKSARCRVKSCGVYPIYQKRNISLRNIIYKPKKRNPTQHY